MSANRPLFNLAKPVIAMIHLGALPGTPAGGRSLREIETQALKEAKIYRDSGVDGLMLEHQVSTARMFVCEIADDPPCAEIAAALHACAFTREGRVHDFFADGVNLDLMVRRR